MFPSWILEIKSACNIKVSVFGAGCQTTVEQRNNRVEVKDEEGYTHGPGMLVRLQALWAYFLTQKTPANSGALCKFEEPEPALNKTSKQSGGG